MDRRAVRTQATNDKKQLLPMLTTITRQSGEMPTQVLADAGYCSEASLMAAAALPIDAYVSTRKQKHGERPGPCPRGRVPKAATVLDRMTRKLQTKAGAAIHAARKAMVEPCSGRSTRRVASVGSCCAATRRCRPSGRWCARRTIFSSCTASACEPGTRPAWTCRYTPTRTATGRSEWLGDAVALRQHRRGDLGDGRHLLRPRSRG